MEIARRLTCGATTAPAMRARSGRGLDAERIAGVLDGGHLILNRRREFLRLARIDDLAGDGRPLRDRRTAIGTGEAWVPSTWSFLDYGRLRAASAPLAANIAILPGVPHRRRGAKAAAGA